ncbi:hypothetical protein BH09MYX1_BH09MYX1_44800 [soil metagenome]
MRFALSFFAAAALVASAGDALAFPQSTHPAMMDPAKATETAPDTFRAKFETTKGDVVFECTRSWAPNGVDRFYNLVKIGFFDDIALFRVAKGFVVQWGIHGDPKVSAAWRNANLQPDPVKESNKRGTLTYAMSGSPDTRSTQLFINYGENGGLDAQGFAPICKVSEGMEIADAFDGEYGERVTGKQGDIQTKGNAYLREAWPKLDYIKTATIVGEASGHGSSDAPASDTKKDETGGSVLPYVIGVFVIGAAVVFFLNQKKEDAPKPKAPLPRTDGPRKKKKKKVS